MTAEQMRMELECFVNQGLQEGWQGWPTKGQRATSKDALDVSWPVPTTDRLMGYVRQLPFSGDRMLLLRREVFENRQSSFDGNNGFPGQRC